jgi:hypothetical protein
MADLFSLAATEEAQGRRRQMLRTAIGPTLAAALADPTVRVLQMQTPCEHTAKSPLGTYCKGTSLGTVGPMQP